MKIADNIGDNEDSVEVFHLFFIQLKDEAFNTSKTKAFLQFQVTFYMLHTYVMYLNTRRDDDDDYDDGEPSDEDKITMSNMTMKNMC